MTVIGADTPPTGFGATPALQVTPGDRPAPERRGDRIPLRRGVARVGVFYSRWVWALKYALPIVALTLVTLVALWPHLNPMAGRFKIEAIKVSIADALNVRIVEPRWTGTDKYNRPFVVTANEAIQDATDNQLVRLQQPKADITLENGTWIALMSEEGTFFRDLDVLDLFGQVSLFHDQGYEFRTQSAQFDAKSGAASGDSQVVGHGPFGHIKGDGFRINGDGTRVTFIGKSKLVIYQGKAVDKSATSPMPHQRPDALGANATASAPVKLQ
ncbi:MAG: LPS export ABC transporter periplasmic protein LptC [Alphaproteobacteria bacterium]